MTHSAFNVSARKVGGIRFLKLGRFNLSFSVSKPDKAPAFKVRAMVEQDADGSFYAVVRLMKDGEPHRTVAAPYGHATAGLARAHALHAARSCGLPLAR